MLWYVKVRDLVFILSITVTQYSGVSKCDINGAQLYVNCWKTHRNSNQVVYTNIQNSCKVKRKSTNVQWMTIQHAVNKIQQYTLELMPITDENWARKTWKATKWYESIFSTVVQCNLSRGHTYPSSKLRKNLPCSKIWKTAVVKHTVPISANLLITWPQETKEKSRAKTRRRRRRKYYTAANYGTVCKRYVVTHTQIRSLTRTSLVQNFQK